MIDVYVKWECENYADDDGFDHTAVDIQGPVEYESDIEAVFKQVQELGCECGGDLVEVARLWEDEVVS